MRSAWVGNLTNLVLFFRQDQENCDYASWFKYEFIYDLICCSFYWWIIEYYKFILLYKYCLYSHCFMSFQPLHGNQSQRNDTHLRTVLWLDHLINNFPWMHWIIYLVLLYFEIEINTLLKHEKVRHILNYWYKWSL